MYYIASKYIDDAAKPAAPLPGPGEIVSWLRKNRSILFFGALSVILYTLLYVFSNDLTHIAQVTHEGDKSLFIVPIVIALVFSLVHGSFTSCFWDVLGVRARKS